MKVTLALTLATALAITPMVFAHGEKNSPVGLMSGLETEPAKVVQSFHSALKSGDKTLARALLADDVQIYEGGNVERSADEYAHHHMLSDMKFLKAMETRILEHQVNVLGNTAISLARSHTTGSYLGKKRDSEGMETVVLEKQNGSWKIVHIHWSN